MSLYGYCFQTKIIVRENEFTRVFIRPKSDMVTTEESFLSLIKRNCPGNMNKDGIKFGQNLKSAIDKNIFGEYNSHFASKNLHFEN